jgi:hypothetical protein
MPGGKKNDSILIAGISMLYTIGIGGIALVVIAYFALKPVSAAPQSAETQPPPPPTFEVYPTFTLVPGVYYLPTVTPNPRSTQIVWHTATPFALGDSTRPNTIGYSVAGRPLEVYTFGKGPRLRMIVAGIHGGYEWNTIALADELIKYIHDKPEVIPKDVTLYILRNMNPDGDARSHWVEGRVNERGVDLNRNFPTNWAADWDREGCYDLTETTGGTGPGSEPETQAVMRFLQTHRIEALISYHSAALGVFPGGEPWDAESSKFAKALSKATKYPFPPVETGCKYTGTLADYAVDLGTVAVDMELSTHTYIEFAENVQALKVLLNWNK